MILSHAHIDHSGRIPKLVKDGFNGEILCTHATRSLSSLMLMDSAKIQERDAYYHNKLNPKDQVEPLYDTADTLKALRQFVGLGYNRWHYVCDELYVQFRDAGHILGSASVTLKVNEDGKETVIGFTGDIGRPNRPILRDPIPMPEVDYLICESTYGDKEHLAPPAELDELLEIIQKVCVKQQGKLMIPAFSIGRTQEIVYMLDQLSTYRELPPIPVYVDSPLAVDATEVFSMHPECFDEDLNEYLLVDKNPFGFKKLKYLRTVRQSKYLNRRKGPCVIISASGMANAGRIKHHIFNNIDDPKNGVLIVGYCAPYTPGGKLKRGAKTLKLFNKEVDVRAKTYTMNSFSAHADKYEMLDFIKNQRGHVKKVFLVHGTHNVQKAFIKFLGTWGFDDVLAPSLGEIVEIE